MSGRKKVGADATVLQDWPWRTAQSGTWKRGTSSEERMTQRTKLGRLWLHERLVKLVEDDHSLTSTEPALRPASSEWKDDI